MACSRGTTRHSWPKVSRPHRVGTDAKDTPTSVVYDALRERLIIVDMYSRRASSRPVYNRYYASAPSQPFPLGHIDVHVSLLVS